jgi:hypothetical protein
MHFFLTPAKIPIWLYILVLIPIPILCGPQAYAVTNSLAEKVSKRRKSELEYNPPTHYELEAYLMSHYNNRLIPRRSSAKGPMKIYFTIGLYQIIEVVGIHNSRIFFQFKQISTKTTILPLERAGGSHLA